MRPARCPTSSPDALVYLFYTSGSTGQPKGVGQTHRNLLFFVDAYVTTLRIGEGDRVSMLYSMSFSAANMDIFGALTNGATLCTYELRRNGIRQLAGWLDRGRISVLHAVPTVFRELAASLPAGRRLPHLRAIDLGGEAVFGRDVELFREHTLEHCILVQPLGCDGGECRRAVRDRSFRRVRRRRDDPGGALRRGAPRGDPARRRKRRKPERNRRDDHRVPAPQPRLLAGDRNSTPKRSRSIRRIPPGGAISPATSATSTTTAISISWDAGAAASSCAAIRWS
jgi:acyl-CoA synthetase (AMP-forming)/AMP-acid ligase II